MVLGPIRVERYARRSPIVSAQALAYRLVTQFRHKRPASGPALARTRGPRSPVPNAFARFAELPLTLARLRAKFDMRPGSWVVAFSNPHLYIRAAPDCGQIPKPRPAPPSAHRPHGRSKGVRRKVGFRTHMTGAKTAIVDAGSPVAEIAVGSVVVRGYPPDGRGGPWRYTEG